MFHTGAFIPGRHPRLEGDTDIARVMRFADPDEVEGGAHDLTAVLKAWCTWKDE